MSGSIDLLMRNTNNLIYMMCNLPKTDSFNKVTNILYS